MSKGNISYFLPPISNTAPDRLLTLEEVWRYVSGEEILEVQRVKRGGSPYRIGTLQEVTNKVRRLSPDEYKRGKTNYLPLVTFGGTFSQRGGEGLQETSGLIGLDIDHISQLGGVSLEALKERISQDREIGVRLVFTSPSGDGLKIVCKTSGEIKDRESYRSEFEILNYFVSQRYSIPIGSIGLDSGISDITRGCLLCYDPGAVLQDWEEIFHSENHPLPKKENKRPQMSPRVEALSPWDFEDYKERRLIPAVFDRIDSLFPDMSFQYSETGRAWYSPYKLDGNPAKETRRDKSVITAKLPGVILEQGGEAVPVITLYANRNNLSYTEAMKELSRLCGLEEVYKDLLRKYAQMKEIKTSTEEGKALSPVAMFDPQKTSQEETSEEREERYKRDFLSIPDLQEIARQKIEGIKTGYQFKTPQGKEEALVLPSGALTFICGRSSHGKTRLLQNLSLQIARQTTEEEAVLYFSFEEGLLDTFTRLANIQIDIPQLSRYDTSNTEVIRDYLETGTLNKSPEDTRREALPRLSEFETLYNSGRLRVYYTPDLLSGDLCSLLEYLSSQLRIKAVFLDYIQAIYKEGYRKDRREELREICKELNKVAISLDVPIVLSAQLNRESPNPTEMSGDNIAESADITRYANTILLLWDRVKGRDIRGGLSEYLNTQEGKQLQEKGFTLGQPGKLYTIISKNRGGSPDMEAILTYRPETGRVYENEDLPQEEDYQDRPLIID